jgi:hypothetical protein
LGTLTYVQEVAAVVVWSEPERVSLSRGRLRAFAQAIGEADRRYVDLGHARSCGHPDLPVPLTFLFTLESQAQDTLTFMTALGVDALAVLHGEQAFEYVRLLHANDEVELSHAVLSDVTRDTGLRVIRRQTDVRAHDGVACRLRSTWLVRPVSAGSPAG